MELKDIVAVSAVRTPMGRFGGTLKDIPAWDLGGIAIASALKRVDLRGDQVSEVIYGNCRQAGNGPNPSRTASIKGGIPRSVSTQTINMACPSGMKTIALASLSIRAGDSEIVVVGGMDSMSTIPYLLKGVRWEGFKMGDKTLLDGWSDSIDPLCNMGMGQTAENLVEKYGISRQEQDQFAVDSHQKAARAQDEGWFDNEIVPVEIPPQGKTPGINFTKDESIRRDTTLEKMATLPAAFKKGGTVTAANACGMTDGATALILMSRDKAKSLGLKPLFSLLAYSSTAVDPETMGEGPGVAIPLALKHAGMALNDMDLIEVNEAFAVQILANERVLQWDRSKLNVHGGAIALGHPTGISGARIVGTLYNALSRLNKELGIASICGGGGVTMGMIIRREN
ncbi:MAG: thiolase family protein [Candidatus Tectomicrobia bacterium]|uniref:Thiolase family protein n=1 Tax=Tectimicrobiota bacterium TaxID=2528274 RepID=A0A932GS42_UNCTE|nr:thiolase family protein [Candidatus Tectomicrobia bacterium]